MMKLLRRMFGLDWRSLALFRMGLAVIILCDLYSGARYLRAFYTDEGILPRDWFTGEGLPLLDVPANPLLRLHMLSGGMWFEGAMLALEAVVAVLLFLGWRTRIVTVLSWVLLLSRQTRNPLIVFGADLVLRVTLFWAMFMPLNRRYSLDARAGRVSPPTEPVYLGIAGFACIGQLLLNYGFNSVTKTGPTWHESHTAVYYAMSLEIFYRPLGHWLNQFDGLTALGTKVVPLIELYCPYLFILPWWNGRGRLLAFGIFFLLQLGFNLCMVLVLFGSVMVVAMVPLLPTEFWTRWAEPGWLRWVRWTQDLRHRKPTPAVTVASGELPGSVLPVPPAPLEAPRPLPAFSRESQSSWWNLWRSRRHPPGSQTPKVWIGRFSRGLGWLRDGALLFLLGYVTVWNLDEIPGRPPLLPVAWQWIGLDLCLYQNFNMFAPDPQTDDGWYVMRGTLANGQMVDAFTGLAPVDFSHPAWVPDTYRGPRWAAVLMQLIYDDAVDYLEPLAIYVGNDWNRHHPPEEELVVLDIYFMRERNQGEHQREPLQKILLWSESFGAQAANPDPVPDP